LVYAHLLSEPPKPSVGRSDVPEPLDRVLAKGMAKKPEDRYGSCADLVAAAAGALGVEPSAPSIPGRPLPAPAGAPPRRGRRFPVPALVGLALGVLAAIVPFVAVATG